MSSSSTDSKVLNTRQGIHLKGKLNGWATAKDVILHLVGKLTVKVSQSYRRESQLKKRMSREEQVEYWSILVQACLIFQLPLQHQLQIWVLNVAQQRLLSVSSPTLSLK